MTIQAQLVQEGDILDWTADAAYSAGDVIQLPDGRAGVVSVDCASGALVGVYVEGIFDVQKTTSMVMLIGSKLFWDHSADKAHLLYVNDRDFYLGCAQEDGASAGTSVKVALNKEPVYNASFAHGYASIPIQTAGFPSIGGGGSGSVNLILQAANEAQKVDALGHRAVSVAGLAESIVDCLIGVNDTGGATAADASIGIANGTHATDFDSVTESLLVHLDGNDLNINLESDDGTTEVAATDTTIDFVEGTPFLVQFDLRNTSDIQCYVNGVLALTASVFKLNAATGPLKPVAHLEKTAATDVYNVSAFVGIRSAQNMV
jgi:predicted RecA/RadA family phage recombinase